MNQNIRFLAVFSISLLVVFAPLIEPSFFRGIENSLLLYYQKFEFNAGIYYAFREFGYWLNGYNMIALIGKLFALATTLFILGFSVISYAKRWQLPNTLLWIATIFALLSLILHPWYIALVILFATMTRYRFAFLWSLLIMGTYAGYSTEGFNEVIPIVVLEFFAVLIMIWIEIRNPISYANVNAK